jgi:hypothetical protein
MTGHSKFLSRIFLIESEVSSTEIKSDFSSLKILLPLLKVVQLVFASFVLALGLIGWEDLSMIHPMRQEEQLGYSYWGSSTVNGLAFGRRQRELLQDLEPEELQSIPSYNEVLLEHRTERVPQWQIHSIVSQDVRDSVSTVQKSLLYLQECKTIAKNYDWEGLAAAVQHPLLHDELSKACGLLKNADQFLSLEARNEIGFDWGSCAWRHCGALADAQEALDELDHLIGILEPFECLFCLDVVERSIYDVLAVTKVYQDETIEIPTYQPLQRMSDTSEEGVDQFDADYLEAMAFLKRTSED